LDNPIIIKFVERLISLNIHVCMHLLKLLHLLMEEFLLKSQILIH